MLDLVEKDANSRQVSNEEGVKLVKERQFCGFFETSAKSGKNVQEAIGLIVETLFKNWEKQTNESSTSKLTGRIFLELFKEQQSSEFQKLLQFLTTLTFIV